MKLHANHKSTNHMKLNTVLKFVHIAEVRLSEETAVVSRAYRVAGVLATVRNGGKT